MWTWSQRITCLTALLVSGAVCFGLGVLVSHRTDTPNMAGQAVPTQQAPKEKEPQFGRWADAQCRVSLEDYVDVLFLLPDNSGTAKEFRELVEPLIKASRDANPPDFICVRPSAIARTMHHLHPDWKPAKEKLNALLSQCCWDNWELTPLHLRDKEIHEALNRVPWELEFLEHLPRKPIKSPVAGKGDQPGKYELGWLYAGRGNSRAALRAIEYVTGKRERVHYLRFGPAGPPGVP